MYAVGSAVWWAVVHTGKNPRAPQRSAWDAESSGFPLILALVMRTHFGKSIWRPVLILLFRACCFIFICFMWPKAVISAWGAERLWQVIAVILAGTDRFSWWLNWHLYLKIYKNIDADFKHPWRHSDCTPCKQFHMYPSKINRIRWTLRSWVSRRRTAQVRIDEAARHFLDRQSLC